MATVRRRHATCWLASCAALVLLATACTSTDQTMGGPPPAAAGLCQQVSRIESLVMRRLHPTAQPYGVPAVVTVRSGTLARATANDLCGLPVFHPSHGPVNCPASTPLAYRLTFTLQQAAAHVATISPTGCATVAGLGTIRAAGAPTLYPRLGHDLGLGPLALVDFTGRPSM